MQLRNDNQIFANAQFVRSKLLDTRFDARHGARMAWNKAFGIGVALVVVLAGLLSASPASAQFIYLNESTAPNDLRAYEWPGTSILLPAPTLTDPLGFPTQGRYTVGDLDGDGNPEIIFTFPILAAQGRLLVYTFDRATGTYGPQQILEFSAEADGRVFTGDVDGDGDDEVFLATFSNDTPAPRPPTGTGHIYVVDVQSLNPPVFKTYHLPNQFITRHAQYAAVDLTGDRHAEDPQPDPGRDGGDRLQRTDRSRDAVRVQPRPRHTELLHAGRQRDHPARPEQPLPHVPRRGRLRRRGRARHRGLRHRLRGQRSRPGSAGQRPGRGRFEGPLTLASPFQHLAAGTMDKDEVPDLVATAGGQPGLTGALHAFRFDTATRTFSLKAAAAVGTANQ